MIEKVAVKQWTVAEVKAAEAIRVELNAVKAQIAELQTEKEDAKAMGKSTAGISRKINELVKASDEMKAQLKGMPGAPMSSAEIVKACGIEKELNGIKEALEKAKATFAEHFATNPTHAIRWDSEDVIAAEWQWSAVQPIVKIIEEGADVEAILDRYYETIRWQTEKQMEWTATRSTSMFTNAAEAAEAEARTRYIRGYLGMWSLGTAAYYTADNYQAWKVLNQ